MEYREEKVITIVLKDDEIDNFKSIIEKCYQEDSDDKKVIGFSKSKFTDTEQDLLKNINEKL